MKSYNQGGALLVALIAIFVIAGSVGIAVSTTGSTARMTDRGRDYGNARLAAEGAIEYGFGIWKKRLQNQDAPISTKDARISKVPIFAGFDYASKKEDGALTVQATDRYGAPMESSGAIPMPTLTSVPGYPGWHGKSFFYLASVRVSQASPRGAPLDLGVKRRFAYVVVPLFQSMFFYEHDLELYKPAPMIVSGLLHTNSNLYLMAPQSGSSEASTLIFQGHVSYVGHYYAEDQPAPYNSPAPQTNLWSSYSGSLPPPDFVNGGFEAQVHQVQRYEPLGPDPASVINTTDANQNNDGLRELIEPPVDGKLNPDPPQIAKRRLYNQAGIIITINGSGTAPKVTVETQNDTKLTHDQEDSIKSAVTGKTTIYDQREGRKVDVANVDIGTLTPILNAASGFNGVLYIHDTTPVTGSDPQLKTIRLQNGGVLPGAGLSIVSQNPVYVQGDYNTGTTTNPNAVPANSTGNPDNTASPTVTGYTRKPAAIMADAVMLLSNAWRDSKSSDLLDHRTASNTTYNVALLSGVMPSGYTPGPGDPHSGAARYGYSGGANNYPRFLEDWHLNSCTYYGSMVELFRSKIFTGEWDTGHIYSPPNRRWNFDNQFMNIAPPGSLDAITITRGSWIRF